MVGVVFVPVAEMAGFGVVVEEGVVVLDVVDVEPVVDAGAG